MYNHAPKEYICPICIGIQGVENADTMLKQADLVYKDDLTSVFMNSFFIDGNEGHLIVVPNKHFENLYDLESEYAHTIMDTVQKMAVVVRTAYNCDGITLRQNNEPAGDQHAFHFHLHIFPRYEGDKFNTEGTNKRATTLEERQKYINKIK
jgi:histidine triad (HIT) family protein